MVINWVKGKSKMNVLNLEHWCNRIAELVHGFTPFHSQHIYREHNHLADRLSKEALILPAGNLMVQEFMDFFAVGIVVGSFLYAAHCLPD